MTAPRRLLAVLLTTLTLIVGACSSDDGADDPGATGAPVLDFALVQDGDLVFEADPTDPGRGIFRVRTTEPMICAIIWGATPELGNFNNSLAMNGTGIVDHDVFLPGAEPGRTYYFQIQGSTADGRQFRSETGTFTIPASGPSSPERPSELGANLALDATVVDASSEFGPGWEPTNAIDGDTATEWATAGDGDDASITLDLGSSREIAAVAFLTRSMLDGTATTETYTVRVDGGEPLGPFPAGNPADSRASEIDAVGQVVTFEVDGSSGGNVGAVEIGVYAPTP